MAATLHLARYRPRDMARMVRAMRRHQPTLEATPGLSAARLMVTAELDPLTGGRPTPLRWGLLCGWESRTARDEFLADGRGLEPFLDGARESWSVTLDTTRVVKGAWHGWEPTIERDGGTTDADGPVAVMTYGRLRARYVPAFTIQNRKIVQALEREPAEVLRIGLADALTTRCTFSVWRSREDITRFAYGPGVHDPIQRESLAVPWGGDYFFARFRPVASTGTLGGRDPVGEVRAR